MPVHACRHPTCTAYLKGPGYCTDHQPAARQQRRDRDRYYDRHVRDADARAFYNSAAWQRARATKLANNPVCEGCERAWARHVHHRKPLRECSPAERVDQRLLMSCCQPCHNAIEREASS